ncbi:MAG TPA: response regulator [Tepidisphaeraceae bacterium]|jgi:CheY-like chemotaxis protein
MAEVLLVDDHPDLREVVGELLQAHGHNVRTCATGEEAIQQIANCPPDVAIVDERLPGMSGLELLARIRQDPKLRSVAVIVCSADDSNQDQARLAGAIDFWLKGTDRLFDAVARLDSTLKSTSRT